MKNIFSHCLFSFKRNFDRAFLRIVAVTVLAGLLHACGGGASTETSPITSNVNGNNAGARLYNGPNADTEDVTQFQLNFWTPAHDENACVGCHVEGGQSPGFVRGDDINLAYAAAVALIDRSNPANSRLVSKVAGGHNCWRPTTAECVALMTGFITDWVSASAGGGRQIQLVAPVAFQPGSTKTFPADVNSTNFATTVWPILTANCAGCHVDTATDPQSPFFASPDVAEAYLASQSKINLNNPAQSRMVLRLRDEFHNCWTNCASDSTTMENAITALSGSIIANAVTTPVVFSNALTIDNAIAAAGGNRYEDNVIALYEFDTGVGSIVRDKSNVPNFAPLNLTISGNDVTWVGGYGIQINDGKAQGTTANSKKLHDLIKASGQYSIEAWVVPANVTQEGPARIISYSASTTARNFTLGQTQYNYDFLQRSSTTDGNGEPALSTADADEDLQASLQHVVVTFDPVNGRRIYVNGMSTGDVDPSQVGNLNDWDDTFAFVLGNEVSNDEQWQGIIRLVAIHDRALTVPQIQQNYAAGVGAKFYLLFGIGGVGGVPDKSYIMFEVEEYDNYSYLFNRPMFINLDDDDPNTLPNITPVDVLVEGMRIGINSKEATVGQSFANLSVTVDAGNYANGQLLSQLGTIIGKENGASGANADEFYLTFETLGTASNPPPVGAILSPLPLPDPGTVSAIGLRTFDEINATMAEITGVDPADLQASFLTMRRALPSVETIEGFLAAQQMSITQLSIEYCDVMVDDPVLRDAFFTTSAGVPINFDFNETVANAFAGGKEADVVNYLYDKMVGLPGLGLDLSDAPTITEVQDVLVNGYTDVPSGLPVTSLYDTMVSNCVACDANDTRTIVKGLCGAVLGSAAILMQ